MLGKLLKYDLKRNMRWLWILFVCTILFAGITRGINELGKSIMFFKITAILFDSLFYALIANSLIQPFLRNFIDFSKSIYGDEGYLTNTLPVTKTQIINSKFLTAFTELIIGFICVILSLLIKFVTPTMFSTLKLILSTVIIGEFSIYLILSLIILLIIVEFLMFLSIILFSIIQGYKSNEKKILKSFIITAINAFISISFLSIVMFVVLLINKVNLSTTKILVSNSAFVSIITTGIIVYSFITILFYFLAKKQFNKGINID